jgi:hypothetical protein
MPGRVEWQAISEGVAAEGDAFVPCGAVSLNVDFT